MRREPIIKPPPAAGRFNLSDYQRACAEFSWSPGPAVARRPAGRGLNFAYEAVDRHVLGPPADAVALRRMGRHGEVTDYSYRNLRDETSRFANPPR